jgi:hypothetical protein
VRCILYFLSNCRAEFVGIGRLFSTGRWSEFCIVALPNTLMGLELLLIPHSADGSHVFLFLTQVFPCCLIGSAWLLGGSMTLAGLVRFWFDPSARSAFWLRFVGGGINLMLWIYVSLISLVEAGGEFPMIFVFLGIAITCYRILYLITSKR